MIESASSEDRTSKMESGIAKHESSNSQDADSSVFPLEKLANGNPVQMTQSMPEKQNTPSAEASNNKDVTDQSDAPSDQVSDIATKFAGTDLGNVASRISTGDSGEDLNDRSEVSSERPALNTFSAVASSGTEASDAPSDTVAAGFDASQIEGVEAPVEEQVQSSSTSDPNEDVQTIEPSPTISNTDSTSILAEASPSNGTATQSNNNATPNTEDRRPSEIASAAVLRPHHRNAARIHDSVLSCPEVINIASQESARDNRRHSLDVFDLRNRYIMIRLSDEGAVPRKLENLFTITQGRTLNLWQLF